MWLQQCACNKTVLPNTGHTTLQKALGDLIGFSARMSHAFCNLDISQFCLGSFGCVWLMHLTTGLVFWPTFHPPGVSESSDRAEGELQNTELMTRELTWWCSAKKEANEFFQNNAAKRHLTTQQRNKESEREREREQASNSKTKTMQHRHKDTVQTQSAKALQLIQSKVHASFNINLYYYYRSSKTIASYHKTTHCNIPSSKKYLPKYFSTFLWSPDHTFDTVGFWQSCGRHSFHRSNLQGASVVHPACRWAPPLAWGTPWIRAVEESCKTVWGKKGNCSFSYRFSTNRMRKGPFMIFCTCDGTWTISNEVNDHWPQALSFEKQTQVHRRELWRYWQSGNWGSISVLLSTPYTGGPSNALPTKPFPQRPAHVTSAGLGVPHWLVGTS